MPADEFPEFTDDVDMALEEALRRWLPPPRYDRGGDTVTVSQLSHHLGDRDRLRFARWIETKLCVRCEMPANSGGNAAIFALVCAAGAFVHHGILPASELHAAILAACESNGLMRDTGGKVTVMASARRRWHCSSEMQGREHGLGWIAR